MGWPSVTEACWATRRASMSIEPPGVNGTTSVIGLEGKSSARPTVGRSDAPKRAVIRRRPIIGASRHSQDNLARRLAREQRIHGLGTLLQGEAHGDVRLELAFAVPLQQLVEVLARL